MTQNKKLIPIILLIFFIIIFISYLFFKNKIGTPPHPIYKTNLRTTILQDTKLSYPTTTTQFIFKNMELKDLPPSFRFFIFPDLQNITVQKFNYNQQNKSGFLISGELNDKELYETSKNIREYLTRQQSLRFLEAKRNEEYSLLEFAGDEFDVRIILKVKNLNKKINIECYVFNK